MKKFRAHFRSLKKKGAVGYSHEWHGEIWIDLNPNENPVITYLHEILHCTYPWKSEKEIKRLEWKEWKKMSEEDKFKLGKELFRGKFNKGKKP